MTRPLLIHFVPGARGDFLAGIVLNDLIERGNGAIQSRNQINYVKVHNVGMSDSESNQCSTRSSPWSSISEFQGIKIYIDPGVDLFDLVLIQMNHLVKNRDHLRKNNPNYDSHEYWFYEKIYRSIDIFFRFQKESIHEHKDLYDHWVAFGDLDNIEFLKNFYFKLNGTHMDIGLLTRITENIQKQLNHGHVRSDPRLLGLIELLDFELKNNLLSGTKKLFDMCGNLANMTPFLLLENYQHEDG